MTTRAVVTIAIGRPIYHALAVNLARSFHRWHRKEDIEFHLITDDGSPLSQDLEFVKVHRVAPGSLGTSFTSKLHLDKFLQCDETLFIDADCLCLGHLGEVFDKFSGREFSVVGRTETEGDLFGNIALRCRKVDVDWTVRFCGSLYYLHKSPLCTKIFDYARSLEPRYQELGLVPLRGNPNEEPLLGLAMAKFGQYPIPEDGSVKADLMFFNVRPSVDVFRGIASIFNGPKLPKPYADWQIPDQAAPKLVHFNGGLTDFPPYTSESHRLFLVGAKRWPLGLATTWTWIVVGFPDRIVTFGKNVLRPMYRRLFGLRSIKRSNRI